MRRRSFLAGSLAGTLSWRAARAGSVTIEEQIARDAKSSTGIVGVYARKLGAGAPIAFNPDEVFPTASISKLLIFVSLFQLAEHRRGVFAHHITLAAESFVGGSEILDGYNPGQTISVDTLMHAMIEQSDNTASNVLIDYVGFDRIRATIHAAGLRHTQLRRHFMDVSAVVPHSANLTTARDMGTLLYAIERGAHEGVRTLVSPALCRRMIAILLKQEDRDKIARGLPPGTPLANKTGEIDGVRNDVGIIDPLGDAPYVLAVLTKDLGDWSLGNMAIRRISKAVHSALT